MKVLLIFGLLLASNFVKSQVEDEGSGFEATTKPSTKSKIKVTVPVKTFKPDDTSSESGSGDDDEDTTSPKKAVEGSGEGSGVEPPITLVFVSTKTTATTQNISPVRPKETTTESVDTKSTSTKYIEDVVTTERTTTISNNLIPTDSKENEVDEGNSAHVQHVDTGNVGKLASTGKGKKDGGLSFVVGIIIGVVVGAILAILIILFLVYRLRKKDQGSYALGDPSTGYHKDEPGSPVSGKEYFA